MRKLVLPVALALLAAAAVWLWRSRPVRPPPRAEDRVAHVLSLLDHATIESVLDDAERHPERLAAEGETQYWFRETFADATLGDWRRFREPRAVPGEESFRVQDAPDGAHELWCQRKGESLYRFVPVAPGTLVHATVRVRGPSPVYAIEYKNPRVADDLERLHKARPIAQVPLAADTPASDELQVVTRTWMVSPRTRLLAIAIAGKEIDGVNESATVREVSVGRAGAREFLAHMRGAFRSIDDGVSHPFAKRLELDARRADALFLPPPTRVSIPLPAALRGRMFRAAVALDASQDSTAGVALTLTSLQGETALASKRFEFRPQDFPFKAAWQDIGAELPPQADRFVIASEPLSAAAQRDSLPFFLCDPVLLPRPNTDARPNVDARPNIVLISIDTLRRDHLSCYGYARPTSPHLDQLAAEGMLFDNAIAQCSYTLPSHVSMLSGQYPPVHGVRVVDDHITPKRTILLSELLREAGYRTAAFAGGLLVHSSLGYERGFDQYADRDPIMSLDGDRLVTQYLEQSLSAPFFLFVHTYAVHDFVTTPRQLARFHQEPCASRLHGKTYLDWGVVSTETGATDEDRRHIVDLYDAAIASTDEFVGRLLARLAALGLAENTLVVLTSDHGKELLDRGVLAHGHTLYDEMIRVPLLVRGPNVSRGRAAALVELVDVTPTLLERVGLAVHDLMQGQSLLGSGRGKSGTYSELVATPAFKHVWRTAAQKIIESLPLPGHEGATRRELYDLLADPGERNDLKNAPFAPALGAELTRVQQALDRRGEQLGRGLKKPTGHDEELLERLRAQGYVGK